MAQRLIDCPVDLDPALLNFGTADIYRLAKRYRT